MTDKPGMPMPYTQEQLAEAQEAIVNLTPEAYLELTELINSLQEQVRLPEAGGFAWVEMMSPLGAKISFGDRAESSVAALRRLRKGLAYAVKEMHLSSPKAPMQPAPQPTTQTTPAAPGAPAVPSAPAVAAPSAPAAPAASVQPAALSTHTIKSFGCVQIEVTPVVGGKVKVGFYGNTHKQPVDEYATVYATDALPKMVATFAPVGAWTEDHFKAAAKYDVSFTVDYREGRLNSKGKPYLDLVALRP